MPALRESINQLVENMLKQSLASGEMINLPSMASEMAESVADMLVHGAPPDELPRMLAHTIAELQRFVREKSAAGEGAQSKD